MSVFGSFRYCDDCWRFYCISKANQSQLFKMKEVSFCIPAQWTGSIVGEMHVNGITVIMLAAELDWNPKYLSTVLNRSDPPKGAEEKITSALKRLIERKQFEAHVAEMSKS